MTRKCLTCGKDFYVRPSHVKIGEGKFCSRKCNDKWRAKNMVGDKSCNWKGGVTEKHVRERTLLSYKEWRRKVYYRDGFTCRECGSKKSGTLNAHHMLSFSKFPQFRFDLWNGVTLCEECHRKAHKKRDNLVVLKGGGR